MTCPNDTDGDGNCGNRHCPHCGSTPEAEQYRRILDERVAWGCYGADMDYTHNPYEDTYGNVSGYPEKLGLTIVGVLDENLGHDFNTFIVWHHEETGKVFYAQDSGCPCPPPFEDCTSLGDLTEICQLGEWKRAPSDTYAERVSWTTFQTAVEEFATGGRWDASWIDPLAADKTELLRKTSVLVKF